MHELPTPPGSTVRADQLSSAVRWTQSAHFMPPDYVSFFFFFWTALLQKASMQPPPSRSFGQFNT